MEDNKRVTHGRADQPLNINPKDVDFKNSAKEDKAQHKPKINQSSLGRDAHQTPADEQMIPMSQIDEGTKHLSYSR